MVEKPVKYKCPICAKIYANPAGLHEHVEKMHADLLGPDMTVARLLFNSKYNKPFSLCIICRQPAPWNETLGRYDRICTNPACKEKYVAIFRRRLQAKRPDHVLTDPVVQRKMQQNRSISGQYTRTSPRFSKVVLWYGSSYELDFLKYVDDSYPDLEIVNCPLTFDYTYEGATHMYLPDFYAPEMELVIEIKDGGDNPNNHPKILAVDKVKESLKDAAVLASNDFNFIKIVNKEYDGFDDLILRLQSAQVSTNPRALFCIA